MTEGDPTSGPRSSWVIGGDRVEQTKRPDQEIASPDSPDDSLTDSNPIDTTDNSLFHDGGLTTEQRRHNLEDYAHEIYGGGTGMFPGDAGHLPMDPKKGKHIGGAGM